MTTDPTPDRPPSDQPDRDREATAEQLRDELTEIGTAFADVPDAFIDEMREAMTDESLGAMLITEERRRAVHELGYGRHHDDDHNRGELVDAALAYIAHAANLPDLQLSARARWPWSPESFRPGSPTRDLVKAGQFIAAEIDRRFRAQHLTEPERPERSVWVELGIDAEYEQPYATLRTDSYGTDFPRVVLEVPESLWREHERTWTRHHDTLAALLAWAGEHGYDVERGRRAERCDRWSGYVLQGGPPRWYIAEPRTYTDPDDVRHRTLDYLGWYDDEAAARAALADLPETWLTVEHGVQRTVSRDSLEIGPRVHRTIYGECERCGWDHDEHDAHDEGRRP